jgi:hypothetical protein
MVNAVPEMGFLTSGNGTITGNGRPISSNGKLRVWVLTPRPIETSCTHASDDDMFVSIQYFPMLNRDCAELHQNLTYHRAGNGNETIVAKIQSS